MSTVYRAYDNVMGREVALKRLLDLEDTNLNEDSKGALQREAGALAKFQHPNVVTIFALEEDGDGPFVAMELVEGEDLNEVVKDAALSVEDFIDVAEQCLDALVSAGDMNLLHRDIKPANIMLTMTPSDRFLVKILDFGLAKFCQQPSTQTLDHHGSFLGSIDYIAPEQLELQPLDQRTDLYSLGCVFYCGLTQESAFQGGNPAETSMNHINHRCTPIQEIRPDLPEHVAAWVMRLISRQPDDRPDDAKDAMKQFQDALKGISYAVDEEVNSGQESGAVSAVPVEPPLESTVPEVDQSKPVRTIQTGPTRTIQTGPTRTIQAGAVKSAASPATGARTPVTGSTRSVGGTSSVVGSTDNSFPLVPVVAGVAAVIGVIAIFAFNGGDGAADKEVVVSVGVQNKDAGALEQEKVTFPDPSTTELPYPGALALASQAGGIPPFPVTDGLVGRFISSNGTFGRDYQRNASTGARVAAWYNLMKPNAALSSLVREFKDKNGNYLPLVRSYTPESLPGLRGGRRGVLLTNASSMEVRSDDFDFSNGVSFVAAMSLEMGQERVIRFSKNPWDRRIIVVGTDHRGFIYGSVSMGPGTPWQKVDIGWWDREPGLIGYVCDVPNKRHRLFKIDKSGREEVTDFASFDADFQGLNKFAIGRAQFDSGFENPNGHVLFEFAVYDRALGEEEMMEVQRALFKRYFTTD